MYSLVPSLCSSIWNMCLYTNYRFYRYTDMKIYRYTGVQTSYRYNSSFVCYRWCAIHKAGQRRDVVHQAGQRSVPHTVGLSPRGHLHVLSVLLLAPGRSALVLVTAVLLVTPVLLPVPPSDQAPVRHLHYVPGPLQAFPRTVPLAALPISPPVSSAGTFCPASDGRHPGIVVFVFPILGLVVEVYWIDSSFF
jgi:hypothetical protein